MAVPSSALAGAAVSASMLAAIVAELGTSVPIPAAVAALAASATRRVNRISAPRVASFDDVAAIGTDLVRTVQAVARAAEPRDASAGLYNAAARAAEAYPVSASPALTREYRLARILAVGIEVACLGEAFLAESRTSFSDRRAATEARDRIGTAMDGATDRIAGALGQAVLAILATAARETSVHLVRLAADLQPIVRVDAQRSFPSTAVAWSLYGDPSRAADLVARNRCGTPLFMPATIEAVAPKA